MPRLARARPQVQPDWTPVADRIRDEATDDWDDTVAVERLEDAGVTFVRGHGRLTGRTRQVDGRRHDVRRPARGRAQPRHRPGGAADRGPRGHAVLDQPRRRAAHRAAGRLVVIGGGAIGVRAGPGVALFGVDGDAARGRRPRSCRPRSRRPSAALEKALDRGRDPGAHRRADRIGRRTPTAAFRVDLGDGERRRPTSCWSPPGAATTWTDLGLETRRARPGGRSLSRPTSGCGSAERLWAVGDITGKGAFTHVSMYQAAVALRDLLGQDGPLGRLPRGAAGDVHRTPRSPRSVCPRRRPREPGHRRRAPRPART